MIPYRFIPWARRGLARAHRNADAAGSLLAIRPRINVGLTLQAKQDGNVATAVSGNIDLTLYGPADVIGIDPKLIVRTDPKPNITNFEPNYLAIVDFDPPDFPWLLTPARANATHHLRPWLVLIVLDRSKVALPRLAPGRPLPSIALTAPEVTSELPNLDESWLWAHAQAISQVAAANPAGLSSEMKQKPERNISRLVCPRRLEPRKNYLACVVPATEGGRLRGLGQPVAGDKTGPAWSIQQANEIELPVYHHWEFSTGPVGDIETLARRLRTPKQYAGDTALIAQLEHIGEKPIAVDGDHLLFDGLTPGRTVFEGAMVSLKFQPAPADPGYANKLETILNSGNSQASGAAIAAGAVIPTLSPPIYGQYPARRHVVQPATVASHWLDGLSLQPRYRLAAGWGAELIRKHQDEFMQAAWAQVGEVLAAERAFSLARLSRDVLKRIEVRHLAKLPPDRLLAVLGPARGRIKLAASESLYGKMAAATLPEELFDGAMRRLTSARRPTFRMAQWRERALGKPGMVAQTGALVDRFANATKNLLAIDPNRFVPDGLLGSKAFDLVPLPADLGSVVDLTAFVGYDLKLSGNALQVIQQQNAAARAEAAVTKKKPPAMGDVWHQGLLTETHALRVAELERAAKAPLAGDIGRLLQQTSRLGTEGILLAAEGGRVTSQGLRIDGRSGLLKAYGSALTVTPVRSERGQTSSKTSSRATRARRITGSLVAAMPLQALKLYGNNAVFTSLPPSTLGSGRGDVKIKLDAPGRFSKIGSHFDRGDPRAVATITMPPALKDHATLRRYSNAFKAYQKVVSPPASSQFAIAAKDFATTVNATKTLSRADPARTVPARLASMLSLGSQEVTWTSGAMANAFIATRLDLALVERLRYVIPKTFDRVMFYPHLLLPLSRKLEILAPDVFLPGVGVLPNDFVMAVKTNPRFVEALMLGANHEMGRELLWQGYPTDMRGTPFQHFWQRLDGKEDIAPIHKWHANPLGAQPGSGEMLVLLIRGQLLERFPNLSIYAYPLDGDEKRPGGTSPPPPAGNPDAKEMDPDRMRLPVLRGKLNKDISYVGFSIDPDDIAKFFFIIEEQMTEPRFGFDEPDNDQQSNTWLDIDWSEVGVAAGQHFGSQHLQSAAPATGARWVDPHAATVADALLQRPFRGYWTGDQLKMPN